MFPKVSCCLCTYDRLDLAKRSIICYTEQTYPNKELIIASEGPALFKTALSDFVFSMGRQDIKIVYLDGEYTLGAIRNVSLKNCTGELYCQWDDDDFNHPKRLSTQIAYLLKEKAFACFLKDQLHYYWEDNELYWEKWDYKSCPKRCEWIPGTIIMRNEGKFWYPETGVEAKAGEDMVLLKELWHSYTKNDLQVACLEDFGYLHVYSFHGNLYNHKNTFDIDHHKWLSKYRGLFSNTIKERKEQICRTLDLINMSEEIKVMGQDGLAFMYKRSR